MNITEYNQLKVQNQELRNALWEIIGLANTWNTKEVNIAQQALEKWNFNSCNSFPSHRAEKAALDSMILADKKLMDELRERLEKIENKLKEDAIELEKTTHHD